MIPNRTPKVITIKKDRAPNAFDGLTCSATMTMRRRKKATSQRPCKQAATRLIGNKPYCDQHGPDRYRIDPYYRSKRWKALRMQVLERDDYRCQYCGKDARQADHVMPRKSGGVDDLANLVACCLRCNKKAAGQVFASFRAKKRYLMSA